MAPPDWATAAQVVLLGHRQSDREAEVQDGGAWSAQEGALPR